MAQRPDDINDRKPAGQQAQTEGKREPRTHHVSVTVATTGTVSATAKVLRHLYIFRCSNKAGLFAVSLSSAGDNLPANICAGEWVQHDEALVEPGISHLPGFVSVDLYRDLDRQGFHIASGVRIRVSEYDAAVNTAVSGAVSTANTRTGFFPTDTDA
jgi:hypothetical protein